MNISLKTASNVFQDNDCVFFDLETATHVVDSVPKLAAMTILCEEKGLPRNLELMDKACAGYGERLLKNLTVNLNYKIWMFLAHGPWQMKSAVVRHNKLWKSLLKEWPLNARSLSQEIMVESQDGIRFAGVAEIGPESLFIATQILRQEQSGAIILSQRNGLDSKDGVLQIFRAAFPIEKGKERTRIDWLSLCLNLCVMGDVIIKIGGSWDERETSLDFIFTLDKLASFRSLGQSLGIAGGPENC